MAEALLLQKCEAALADYLISLAITDNIYEGKAQGEKAAPCVICSARSAAEDDPPRSGNKWVECEVTVKYLAPQQESEDNVADSNTLSGEIFDALQTATIQDDLTTTGLTVMGAIFEGVTQDVDGECFVDNLRVRLYACPKTFS